MKIRSKLVALGLIVGLTIPSCAMVFANSIDLKDIPNHWGKIYIQSLINKGAINGYEDSTFRPDNNISNAEFTKILVTSLGYKLENAEGHWANNYINKAQELSILENNEFSSKEDNKITRGQMAKMIIRSINENYDSNIGEFKSQIKDFNLIPNSYQDYVLKAYTKGIITGYGNGTFKYERPATRAEATTMIVRMLEIDKRIIPILDKNKDKIIIDGKEISVEATEIIKPYNEVIKNLENVDGDFKAQYYDYINEVGIFYAPQGEAKYENHTMDIGCTTSKAEYDIQYEIAIYAYDEKTYKALKEVLKIFYPNNYENTFNEIKKVANTKGESKEMNLDNRRFKAKYFETFNEIYIQVGGAK